MLRTGRASKALLPKIAVLVMPTDEEQVIAEEALSVLPDPARAGLHKTRLLLKQDFLLK